MIGSGFFTAIVPNRKYFCFLISVFDIVFRLVFLFNIFPFSDVFSFISEHNECNLAGLWDMAQHRDKCSVSKCKVYPMHHCNKGYCPWKGCEWDKQKQKYMNRDVTKVWKLKWGIYFFMQILGENLLKF